MAKSPPSPFPGTQCCFPLTNYLSSPLQTHSFAQTPDCKCNLFKGHVMRCANGKLLDLKQCSAFIIIVTRYSTPACCMFSSSCCISHDATPWSHLVTWWHCDDPRFIKADGNIVIFARALHILRDITRPISMEILWLFCGNIVASAPILARYHCGRTRSYCVTSLDRSSQKAFSLKQQVFAAWRRDYANVDRLHSGQRLKAMIVTENSTEKDLKILRNSGSQQWPSTIFMCAKSFTFPRNFPRR